MADAVLDKKDRLLHLFGLREDFTAEELAGAYRMLAKLNHPDLNRDTASEMRMVIINDGYAFLREYVKTRPPVAAGNAKEEDLPYLLYRNAFMVLKNAFDDYFGELEDRSLVGNISTLRERLMLAKKDFWRLVNELPYSPWVDDAIDKISSINKWL